MKKLTKALWIIEAVGIAYGAGVATQSDIDKFIAENEPESPVEWAQVVCYGLYKMSLNSFLAVCGIAFTQPQQK